MLTRLHISLITLDIIITIFGHLNVTICHFQTLSKEHHRVYDLNQIQNQLDIFGLVSSQYFKQILFVELSNCNFC